MIKRSIQGEDVRIVNIYDPNIRSHQFIIQTVTEIRGEIDSNTIIGGDYNTPLMPMDRSSKQKIKKNFFGSQLFIFYLFLLVGG